jgi:hypothetical protein
VDSVWEQEKHEARKMLLNRADSHTSGARGVGWRFVMLDSLPEKDTKTEMTELFYRLLSLARTKNLTYQNTI